MDNLIYIFAGIVLLAAALATISIWSPRQTWVKVCALAATAGLIAVVYVGFVELLSKPKPVGMEWSMRSLSEAKVVSSRTQEGTAIFLWLQISGVAEPRAYRLPWDRELAQQLQKAMREAKGRRGNVVVRQPFNRDGLRLRDEPVFYATPRSATPPKITPQERPLVFGSRD